MGINMKILLLAFLVSCSAVKLNPEPIKIIPAALIEVPNRAPITVSAYKNFSPKYQAEFEQAVIKANEIIGTKCFEDFMLQRKLIQTNGKTNAQVVAHIRSTPTTIELSSYRKWGSVVGWTTPTSKIINVNSKFYIGSSRCAKTSNLVHEVSHKQGFGHDFKPNRERPFSVPYSLNQAVEACCK